MRLLMVAGCLSLAACLAWTVEVGWGGGVKEGAPAPSVKLQATQIGLVLPEQKDATTLDLQAFKGKKNVVLFFFPKAMTKG